MTEQRSTRKIPTLALVLGPLAIVVLVGLGVYMMVSKPKPPTAAAPSARERAEAAAESSESDVPQLIPASEWSTRIAIRSGDSPFRPGRPGALEQTGEPSEGMEAESGETETPAESETEGATTPPEETPSETTEGRPGPRGGGGAGTSGRPGPRPAEGGTPLPDIGAPPVGGGPAPTGATPAPPAEVEVVQQSREDRTNERMRQLFPRDMMPGRGPGRTSPVAPPELTVTGTVVGRDGGTSAVITDGTSRYFVRQGQTLNLAGRNMRVLSVDRGRVVLEDERGAMTLQANGGAAR